MSLWRDLTIIHSGIQSRFSYVSDRAKYGKNEHWAELDEDQLYSGQIEGDCDDFALACRQLCREKNIASRLVLCKTEDGGYHLVTEVQGWILDNRQDRVMPREDLDYKWLKISGYGKGEAWRSLISLL